MKKLQFIFAAVALLVLSLGMTGCDPNDPNNPDNPATSEIVSTSETNNGDGIVVEVIYKNNIRLYFELTSPTECALTLYQDYYGWYKEGFEQYAYSGDLVIPETITHKGVTYTVTDISYGVREYSGNVTTVWIPKTVIDDNIIRVVQYWWELTAINVATDNPKFASVDGHLFDNTKTKFLCYARANTGESYTVPDGVKEIYEEAFRLTASDRRVLRNITLPNGLKIIGKGAFQHCNKLQTITIPNGVIEIGTYAFGECSSLKSMTIPESVTSIGESAFYGCSGLTSVSIPENVTQIESYAFGSCYNLTSITIPNGVTSLGVYAFNWCQSLTSIIIPSSVTNICKGAFSKCTNLITITCLAIVPPVVWQPYNDAFEDSSIRTVKVPAGSVEAYRAAVGWRNLNIVAL